MSEANLYIWIENGENCGQYCGRTQHISLSARNEYVIVKLDSKQFTALLVVMFAGAVAPVRPSVFISPQLIFDATEHKWKKYAGVDAVIQFGGNEY